MIRNVICDMGNVLLDYNPRMVVDTFCDTAEEKDVVMRELFKGPEWGMMDEGILTKEECLKRVCSRCDSRFHEKIGICLDRWTICMKPLPGVYDFLADLRCAGYGLYVLSNAAPSFHDYFPESYPDGTFNGIVVSCDEKLVKPDLRIYELICDRYDLTPEECIFVDDREENVEAARKIGMHAVTFEGDYGVVWRYLIQDMNRTTNSFVKKC